MTDLHQPEDVVAYNQRSLQTLVRAIALSQGQFSLILARCNYAALRERMVQRLREQCPVEIRELVLPKSVKTLYTTIQAELGSEQPPAVMVFGLESVRAIDQVLTSTNQVREEFRKSFTFPLVLWINDEVLRHLIRLAPDFESWATTTEFALATDELITFLQQSADSMFADDLHYGADTDVGITPYNPLELKLSLKYLQGRGQVLEPDQEANRQFILGRLTYFHTQREVALAHYQQNLVFWQQNGNLERQGVLLYRIALCYADKYLYWNKKRWDWERARNYLQQCVDVFEQAQRQDLVAKFIGLLGEALRHLQAWEELQTVAQKSLALHQTYEPAKRAFTLHEISFALDQIGRPPILLARDYGFLAEVALNQSNWAEANRFAHEALKVLAKAEVRHIPRQALYRLFMAQSQQHLGQLPEAITSLEEARGESDPKYDPLLHIRILETLRSLYFEQGEYLKSFEIKQERRSIEYQYNFQAFAGASHLQPKRQVINPALAQTGQQAIVAQEIAASGRQQDVNRLIERISRNDHKLTVIHGQSGVGKSSIVKAGLVPALKQRAIGDRDALPIVLRVYTNWVRELGRALAEEIEEISGVKLPAPLDSVAAISEQLRKNEDRNLLTVLIFDQFEEFFFVGTAQSERRPFFEFLRYCLNIRFVKIILSLREDYLHYLLEGERFINLDAINNNILDKNIRYYLGNLSPKDAMSVIQSLTERSQFYLEPALIDELVRDLAGKFGEVRPIELQVVGAQLQTDKITTLAQYQQYGPKEKLVERSLEEVIKDCGPPNERAARLVLYLLTDENGNRPLKTRTELVADLEALDLASEIDKLDLVLEVLVGAGLVFLVPEAPVDRYQLIHDYLVTFIRQQQAPGLLAELSAAKEKQRLTEEELIQTLRRLRWSLHQEQQQRRRAEQEQKRAEIAEIEALSSLSQALLLSHDQLGALVASVKAGRKLKETEAPHDVKIRTVGGLQQAVYGVVRERNRFQGHVDSVLGVSFSPDGQMLASASADKTVKLWSLDGTLLKNLQGHNSSVLAVSFSPNGQMLASASADKTVKLWSLEGTLLKTLKGHKNFVLAVSFSPNGKILASVSRDKTIKLWKLDGTLLKTLQEHNHWVLDVNFSPDGETIASASVDKTIKLWRLDGTLLKTLQWHKKRVLAVSFSPDGQILTSASLDKTIKPWRLGSTSSKTYVPAIYQYHSAGVLAVSFSPDSKILASASWDGTVQLLIRNGTLSRTPVWHGNGVLGMSFSPDSKILASANDDGTVRLWSIDGTEPQTFLEHSYWIYSVSFSPDGQTIASASTDNTVKLWSRNGHLLRTFQGHNKGVYSVSFSPDGKTIASASADNTVKLWNHDGHLLRTFQGHSEEVYSVSFSPDGKTIASASADKTVKLWSHDGHLLRTFQGHSKRVYSVSFSPDGQTIASASGDNTVKLWNPDGMLLKTLHEHSNIVWSVSFSPDGQTIVSASGDRTMKLWNRDGTLLKSLQGHSSGIKSVSFSPDGKTIVSASYDAYDATIKLWSLNGTELQTFQGHSSGIYSVTFSPDGKTIASGNYDGTVTLWNLDLDDLIVRGCERLRDYLKTNPNVSESDRHLCDDI